MDVSAAGDRGATLVELVVAMLLTALAAGSIVGLVAGSAETVERVSGDDDLVAIAADWFVRDVREASALDVIETDGSVVRTLDITTPDGVVRWGSTDGALQRWGPGAADPQVIVTDLHLDEALTIVLETSRGAVVDPDDVMAVAACARLVAVTVVDVDGTVVHERAVGLRNGDEEAVTC